MKPDIILHQSLRINSMSQPSSALAGQLKVHQYRKESLWRLGMTVWIFITHPSKTPVKKYSKDSTRLLQCCHVFPPHPKKTAFSLFYKKLNWAADTSRMFTAITSHLQGLGRDLRICPTWMCPTVHTVRLCHLSLWSSQSVITYCDAYSIGFVRYTL